MAITYKSQGAGASTETSGAALSPACPATVDANDILLAHVFWEGTTTTPSTPAGWKLLSGPHVIETTIARHWLYGKIADGTEDAAAIAFGAPAVTTQRGARIYSFAGYVKGAIDHIVRGFAHVSHATDPQGATVTTTKAGSLAVLLIAQNDNNTIDSMTGESGGDWTEAVAEFTAALTPGLLLAIQTCTPTSNPGTVSGGTFNTANDPVGVLGFEIADSPLTDVSDSVTVTEDVTVAIVTPVSPLAPTVNDAITLDESTTVKLSVYVPVSDSVTVAEDITVLLPILVPTVFDAVTVSESATVLLTTIVPAVSDEVTVADAHTVLLTSLMPAVSDAVTVADEVVLLVPVLVPSVFDDVTVVEDSSVTITAAPGGGGDLSIDVHEVVTVSDSHIDIRHRTRYRGSQMFAWELNE